MIKILKNKNIMYIGTNVKLTTDFSLETMQARRQWSNIFHLLKKKCQHGNLYTMKTSFKNKNKTSTPGKME